MLFTWNEYITNQLYFNKKNLIIYLIATNWLSSSMIPKYWIFGSWQYSQRQYSEDKGKLFFFLNGNSMPYYTSLWYIELIYINEKAFPSKCIYLFIWNIWKHRKVGKKEHVFFLFKNPSRVFMTFSCYISFGSFWFVAVFHTFPVCDDLDRCFPIIRLGL